MDPTKFHLPAPPNSPITVKWNQEHIPDKSGALTLTDKAVVHFEGLAMKGAVPDYKTSCYTLGHQYLLQARDIEELTSSLRSQSSLIQRKNAEAANLQSELTRLDATLDRYLNPTFWDRVRYLFGAAL